MKTRYAVITLALVILAGAAAWMTLGASSEKPTSGSASKPKKTPVVAVAEASRTTICRRLDLTGSAEPYRVAHLASPAEGPVEKLSVREGDRVKADEKLVLIGRRQGAEALITSLREELKKEEANLRRVRRLIQANALAVAPVLVPGFFYLERRGVSGIRSEGMDFPISDALHH